MAILGKATKQPIEVQDYDVSFANWLAALSDTASTHTVTADDGITIDSSELTGGIVKVWLSGGTDGTTYKITAKITTAGGRVKEDEIKIKIKET